MKYAHKYLIRKLQRRFKWSKAQPYIRWWLNFCNFRHISSWSHKPFSLQLHLTSQWLVFFQPRLDKVCVVLFAIYLRRLISCSFIFGPTFPIIVILISAGRCSSSYGILVGKKKCFNCYSKNCQTCNVSLQKLIFTLYSISIYNVSLTCSLTFRSVAPESFRSPSCKTNH